MGYQLTEEEALAEIEEINKRVLDLRKRKHEYEVVRQPDRGGAAFTIKVVRKRSRPRPVRQGWWQRVRARIWSGVQRSRW